jgi:hypothetical protein
VKALIVGETLRRQASEHLSAPDAEIAQGAEFITLMPAQPGYRTAATQDGI